MTKLITKNKKDRSAGWFFQGRPWVWITAGSVSLSLLSVLALLLMIGWKGLAYFWPAELTQWQDKDGKIFIGQVYQRAQVPLSYLSYQEREWPEEAIKDESVERLSVKVANRDLYPHDVVSVLALDLFNPQTPEDLVVLDRIHDGDFFGRVVGLKGMTHNQDLAFDQQIEQALIFATEIRKQIQELQKNDLQQVSYQLESVLNKKNNLNRKSQTDLSIQSAQELQSLARQEARLTEQLTHLQAQVSELQKRLSSRFLIVKDMSEQVIDVPLSEVADAWYPNQMSFSQKLIHWFKKLGSFVSDDPRGLTGEGGVFPAIFGTIFLVLLMSVLVMPFGVICAVYLHEYAKPNRFTQLIRVAIVNLAGVPSIVYGVFGLGFFVYTLGSSIDTLLYQDALPRPTWGTPGLLWSALTLAILTLPVVVVTTEEGLSRIPSSMRNASYALGATQFETLWKVVLPMATPAILTALILAVARAAGEVAPLMLVGVVKLAPSLPVDGHFPYLHLERKFMHLGFHIYNLGFQNSNIESVRPLVYATSALLISVVVLLNISAIMIRNNLREKYRLLTQD